ncbi:hypothetical protein ACFSTD_09555 [Novosphingobium colocasiae]
MARRIGQAGWRRLVAALGIGALTLLLAACLFAPGKFTSSLDIGKDRSFTFRYSGEIYMLPLIEAEKEGALYARGMPRRRHFRRAPLPPGRAGRTAKGLGSAAGRQAQERCAGGAVPVRWHRSRQPGRRAGDRRPAPAPGRVEQGDLSGGAGRFAVDYVLSGRLDHDFTFPTVERFPMANAFVQIALRDDGSVRIDAPGFGPAGGGSGAAGLMGGLGGMTAGDDGGKPNPIDGTFIIRTDGQILANNTDEGPVAETTGKALAWTINPRTQVAPMALVQLSPR